MAIALLHNRSAALLPRPAARAPGCTRAPGRLMCVVPAASKSNPGGSKGEENPYTTRSRKSNPGGSKDKYVRDKDKENQFEYQQERLEWRRKNQFEGIEDREEPPHNNMAQDMSAERRGPDVAETSGHGDTLKEAIKNVKDSLTGKKHKDDK